MEAISTTERRASAGVCRGADARRDASAPKGIAAKRNARRRSGLGLGATEISALGGAMGPQEVEASQPLVGLPTLGGEAVLLLELLPGGARLVPLLLALEQPGLAVQTLALGAGLDQRLEARERALEIALRLERDGLAFQREHAEGVVGSGLGQEGLVEGERGVVVALVEADVGQRQGGGEAGGRVGVARADRLEGLGQRGPPLLLRGEGFFALRGFGLTHGAVDQRQGLRERPTRHGVHADAPAIHQETDDHEDEEQPPDGDGRFAGILAGPGEPAARGTGELVRRSQFAPLHLLVQDPCLLRGLQARKRKKTVSGRQRRSRRPAYLCASVVPERMPVASTRWASMEPMGALVVTFKGMRFSSRVIQSRAWRAVSSSTSPKRRTSTTAVRKVPNSVSSASVRRVSASTSTGLLRTTARKRSFSPGLGRRARIR